MAHVIRGCLTLDWGLQLTPDPCERLGFFHFTLCRGELGSVVGHLIVDNSLNYEEDR